MTNPKVSVILPAFNAEKFIEASVSSILNQSYRNIELIAIDDGSRDRTLEIIEKFSFDRRLKIITRENRGLIATLNEAIGIASGDYIARMDADDFSHPERLQIQLSLIESTGADVVGSAIKTFGFCRPSISLYPTTDSAAKFQLLFNTCFAHPCIFSRRQIFEENLYDQNHKFIEDYELWTRMASRGAIFINSPEVLLNYRKTLGQATTKMRSTQDRLRPEIAEFYREKKFPNFPKLGLYALHDREASMAPDVFNKSLLELLDHAKKFSTEEMAIFRRALSVCILHNSNRLSPTLRRAIGQHLGLRVKLTSELFNLLDFGPSSNYWKFLYLMK